MCGVFMNNKIYSYLTINTDGEAKIEIKKSRFIAFIKNISSEDEAKEFILQIRKKYYDARHVCFAYILGEDAKKTKNNDDGEPAGSAGVPILEALKKNSLTNVIAVVVRYFGGIELGVAGLIKAYFNVVIDAIKNTQIDTMKLCKIFSLECNYDVINKLINYLTINSVTITKKDFKDKPAIIVAISDDNSDKIVNNIKIYFDDLIKIEYLESKYIVGWYVKNYRY